MPNANTANGMRRVAATGENAPPLDDLMRLLVNAVTAAHPGSHSPDSPIGSEEIIVDRELDGARYLLVRLPAAGTARAMLSPREQEIVRMVAQGHPNKVIADVLSISSWTVGTHLRRIFAKLGVGSRAAMVARFSAVDRSSDTRPGDREDATTKKRLTRQRTLA